MAHFYRVKNAKGQFENVEVPPPVVQPVDLNPSTVTLSDEKTVVCDICKRKFSAHGPFAKHFASKHGELKLNPDSWKSYAGVTH